MKDLKIKILEEYLKWEDSLTDREHDKIGSYSNNYLNLECGGNSHLIFYIKNVLK